MAADVPGATPAIGWKIDSQLIVFLGDKVIVFLEGKYDHPVTCHYLGIMLVSWILLRRIARTLGHIQVYATNVEL